MLDVSDRSHIYHSRHVLKQESADLKELIKDCETMTLNPKHDEVLLYYSRTIKRIDDAISALDSLVELWAGEVGEDQEMSHQ